MKSLATGLRNLLVRVGADVSQLRAGLKTAQSSVNSFGRNMVDSMKGVESKIQGIMAGLTGGFIIGTGVKDAMRHEALMTTLGESMGESRKEFEKWQETVGNAYGFSRVEGANLANTLSLNFKKIATDQSDLVAKTTKMMELAGVISNKRGMTMQEVSDRIRSAMNQEADGADELGVNVRVAAIQTSKAYQEMADGQPWDKLNEHMRKTILYSHIVEQVTQNLGSTMQDTTQARMSQFSASLVDVRMALGQAFLPIVYTVLPMLNAMAQSLYKVLQVVSAFTRALFGGFKYQSKANQAQAGAVSATDEQAKSVGALGDAQEKAGKQAKKSAKEAKRGVASFDEINQLAESAGAGAGGAGGAGGGKGADIAMPELPSALPPPDMSGFEEAINGMVEFFKKKLAPFKDFFRGIWIEITSFFSGEMTKLRVFWARNGDQIIQALKFVAGIVIPIFQTIVRFVWNSFKMLVSGVLQFFQGLIKFFAGVFTGDWKKAWEGLKDMFFGALKAIMGFWNLTFVGGLRKILFEFFENAIKAVANFITKKKDFFSKGLKVIWEGFINFIKGLKAWFDDFVRWIQGRVEWTGQVFKNLWTGIKNAGSSAVSALKSVWGGISGWFGREIVSPIVDKFENIKNAFSRGIGQGFREVINQAIRGFNNALAGFNRLKNKTPFANDIPDLKIPYLAKGGIATGATLAMVGEGREDEAIAPLSKLQGFVTNAVMEAMRANGGRGANGDIILTIDGRRLARIVKPYLDSENKRIGANVKLNTL